MHYVCDFSLYGALQPQLASRRMLWPVPPYDCSGLNFYNIYNRYGAVLQQLRATATTLQMPAVAQPGRVSRWRRRWGA